MTARTTSCVLTGIVAHLVEVEVDVAGGLPNFAIVGLPGSAVRESKDRVRAALRNTGFQVPDRKITVNLAPGHLRKEGTCFDLAIALALLAADDQVPVNRLAGCAIVGELSLDGRVKAGTGMLPIARRASSAGLELLLVPAANAAEAALGCVKQVLGLETLRQAVELLRGEHEVAPTRIDVASLFANRASHSVDFAEVRGQPSAKRAFEVAAAGGHNVLLVGPPGSGKTMLARRLPTILPELTLDEALETTSIYSVAGLLGPHPLIAARPLRAPHHTVSEAALVGGGGTRLVPGELALAHLGVLFLDELPEFSLGTLEALRQPLEDRAVTISRVVGSCTFPADAIVVGAMNPCPCGYAGDPSHLCSCTPGAVQRYRQRISGPLLDRLDLHVEVPALSYRELAAPGEGEPSGAIRERVTAARTRQTARLHRPGIRTNARMNGREIDRFCALDARGARLLETAVSRLGLSARAYSRVFKVARTIADLAAEERIAPEHVAEALQYRALDRRMA